MRLLGIHSKRTVKAYNRCASLLAPEIVLDRNISLEDCDGVFVHNTLQHPKTNKPVIMYLCSGSAMSVYRKGQCREWLKENPLAALWVNCNSAHLKLLEHGIKSTVMYRPNIIHIPKTCTPMPKERRILWYWIENDIVFGEVEAEYVKTVAQLADVEIWVIPSKKSFLDAPNVKALGQIKMGQTLPQVHGMIRASLYPDFGRSMFDVLAHGRWVWTTGMNEPFVDSTNMENLAASIRARLDAGEINTKGHEWIATKMNEAALRKRWVNTAKKVLASTSPRLQSWEKSDNLM